MVELDSRMVDILIFREMVDTNPVQQGMVDSCEFREEMDNDNCNRMVTVVVQSCSALVEVDSKNKRLVNLLTRSRKSVTFRVGTPESMLLRISQKHTGQLCITLERSRRFEQYLPGNFRQNAFRIPPNQKLTCFIHGKQTSPKSKS